MFIVLALFSKFQMMYGPKYSHVFIKTIMSSYTQSKHKDQILESKTNEILVKYYFYFQN